MFYMLTIFPGLNYMIEIKKYLIKLIKKLLFIHFILKLHLQILLD